MEEMPSKYSAEMEGVLSKIFLDKGTVLSEFLTQKVLQYEEPKRKGTPKGDTIGFGRKKVWAAFLAATGYNPIDVYHFLLLLGVFSHGSVSYGSIRHWFTEPQFKRLVLQFQEEIAAHFADHLMELSKQADVGSPDVETASIMKRFGSAKDYGPGLTEKILLTITDRLNESKSLLLLWVAHLVLRALSRGDEEGNALDKALDSFLRTHIWGFAFHVSKNPGILLRLSPTERKQYSKMLQGYVLEEGGRCAFFDFDHIERLLDNDSWTLDGLRFTGKAAYLRNGQIIRKKSRRGRPRKNESKRTSPDN